MYAHTRESLGTLHSRSSSKSHRAQVGARVSIDKYIETVAASCTVAARPFLCYSSKNPKLEILRIPDKSKLNPK